MASLGIADGMLAKASKENQAAVKSMESLLESYANMMIPMLRPSSAQGSSEDEVGPSRNSHKVLLDINEETCFILRHDIPDIEAPPTVDLIIKCLLNVHGKIGWLPDLSNQVDSEIDSLLNDNVELISEGHNKKISGIPAADSTLQLNGFASLNEKLKRISLVDMENLNGKCNAVGSFLSYSTYLSLTYHLKLFCRFRNTF